MSLQQQFDEMAEKVKSLSKKPTDDELLELYGLYKQSTVGDNTSDKPSALLDFKGKKKWETWNSKKGLSKTDAQKAYVEFVQQLQSKYS